MESILGKHFLSIFEEIDEKTYKCEWNDHGFLTKAFSECQNVTLSMSYQYHHINDEMLIIETQEMNVSGDVDSFRRVYHVEHAGEISKIEIWRYDKTLNEFIRSFDCWIEFVSLKGKPSNSDHKMKVIQTKHYSLVE